MPHVSVRVPLLLVAVAATLAPPAALAATPATAPGVPAAAPALAASPDAPRPVLVLEQPRLDLGVVREGQDAVATFVVRNTGQAELKILNVRPG